ncbi:MAG: SIS domain-containing protein [Anaerolineales bacterium]|nr:SIS domain-containing protein [Anaerolineales bacterium]
MYEEYLDKILTLLQDMKKTQGDAIKKAAAIVGEILAKGDVVYTFGSGHSQLLARELVTRAGGLVPIYHLPDPIWGMAEQLEGYGKILFDNFPVKAGEAIFIISNSGRNPEPIEIAMEAKARGLKVIAVTSLEHSKTVQSRHSSGKKLYEFADVVLDSLTPRGDALMSFDGVSEKAGAASTILGAALLNAVMLEAAQYMLDKGVEPPVLVSQNLDGGLEHNQKLQERYRHMAWAPYYYF